MNGMLKSKFSKSICGSFFSFSPLPPAFIMKYVEKLRKELPAKTYR